MRRIALAAALAALIGAPGAARAAEPEYKLGPRDLVEIKVFQVPELNVERRVSDAGTVALPLIGDVPAAGLTATSLKEQLAKMLTAKYVQKADVSVTVKEYGSHPVSVLGAVQHPGSLAVSGRFTLLSAISAAGGLTGDAGRKIVILRQKADGRSDALEVPVAGLFGTESERWNVPIYPADVVNIPPRTVVKVFCLGEVKQPGALEFSADDRISLLSAVAKAGGLTDRASSRVRIRHRGPDGRDVESVANMSRIVSGKEEDPRLSPDDVVIVKESFF